MKKILLLFLAVNYLECTPRRGSIVMTADGPVQGIQSDTGDYTMYLGVPYGVIQDNNPFADAKPPPRFTSVFEAVSDPVLCPQIGVSAETDINCLNLNIYVPKKIRSKHKLPVMFYIPGGAFALSNANRENLGPELLIKHDVIIITVNYRVGIYGFLCLDTPGFNNQGLKDQILAMEWMKRNVESFGGDINRITVFGQSAGAMTLDILLLAKEPLFQRAIIQSGVARTTWVIAERNNSIPIDVAKELGFETDETIEALNYLKTMNTADVVTTASNLNMFNYKNHPLTKPCVEDNVEGAVLTDYPINLRPKVKDLDIMIGHTFREATFRYPINDEVYYQNYNFDTELVYDFDVISDEQDIRHYYLADRKPSFSEREKIWDFASDIAFAYPTETTVEKYLEEGARNVYRYLFTYEGNRNLQSRNLNLTSNGALHGDDVAYLWNRNTAPEELNEADQKMIDIMTKMWTDFAKYGNPTPSGPTDLIPVTWEPVAGDQRPYLQIDEPLSLEHRVFNERMVFWDMYYRIHANDIKGKRS